MRQCKCGNQVAGNARTCPKCGHRFTRPLVKGFAWFLGISFGIGMIGMIAAGPQQGTAPAVSASAPPHQPYVLPAEFFLKPVAERGPEGDIYISGTTNFPDGMKMWVILGRKKAQQDAFVRGGQFRSGPFYQKGPVITGSQPLELTAYFNGAWQDRSVISLLGEGGKHLHGSLFKLTDPDVVDSNNILEATFTISLPAVAPEVNAISIVKHAVLSVPGAGRSATDIEDNLVLFTTPGTGVTKGKGWSAIRAGTNVYSIAYDFIDGSKGEQQALWSVNVATKEVKYVNEYAKLFSWTPNY